MHKKHVEEKIQTRITMRSSYVCVVTLSYGTKYQASSAYELQWCDLILVSERFTPGQNYLSYCINY